MRDASGTPRLDHQPGLEGLRGLAVLAVLLYHAGLGWIPGGYLGVSTFFTLSGFLITSLLILEHEQTGRIDLAAFWARRARRIAPAALFVLAAIVALALPLADASQLEHLRGDVLATLGLTTNWWFVATRRAYADIWASPSPVQHFWSLAIEEQFYVLFPPLVALVLRGAGTSRRRLGLVLSGLMAASVASMLLFEHADASTARLYYGTDTRAAELLAGALLAVAVAGRPLPARGPAAHLLAALGVAGVALTLAFWSRIPNEDPRLYTGGLALYAAASVAVVTASVLPGGPVRRILAAGPLCWLGRLSYGAYLYHFPIFLWVTPARTGLAGPALLALRLGLTLLVAQASYGWLEMPVRTRRLLPGRRGLVAGPVAAAAVATVLVLLTASGGTAPPPAASSLPPPAPPAWQSAIQALPDAARVLVIGDSVARGIGDAVRRWGKTTGRAVVRNYAAAGCGLARGGWVYNRETERREALCDEYAKAWPVRVEEFRADVVLVYSDGWDQIDRQLPGWDAPRSMGDPTFEEWLRGEYAAVIEAAAARGARVVWLTAMCLNTPVIGPADGFATWRRERLNREVIMPVVAAHRDRAAVVDLFERTCPGGKFADTFEGVPNARPDGQHFSDPAADQLVRSLGPLLVQEAVVARKRRPATATASAQQAGPR